MRSKSPYWWSSASSYVSSPARNNLSQIPSLHTLNFFSGRNHPNTSNSIVKWRLTFDLTFTVQQIYYRLFAKTGAQTGLRPSPIRGRKAAGGRQG